MKIHLQVAKKTVLVIVQAIIVVGLVLGGLYGVACLSQWKIDYNMAQVEAGQAELVPWR